MGEVDVQSFVNSPYNDHTGIKEDLERQTQRRTRARNYCAQHPDWLFVACDGDEIIGFATLEYLPDERTGRIQNNCVLCEYRGRGISTRLVRHALNELERLGADHVKVHTRYVPAARTVYEKVGFRLAKQDGHDLYYEMTLPTDT